ncbi:MAG: hypothetical protein ABIF18_02070, partial [archaeon]
MDKQFYLDWSKHKLWGLEDRRSRQAVDAIIRGVRMKDEFPPVFVYQISELEFSIVGASYTDTTVGRKKDGGHTRARGHNLIITPLLCQIEKNRPDVLPGYLDPYGTINISEIVLIDD